MLGIEYTRSFSFTFRIDLLSHPFMSHAYVILFVSLCNNFLLFLAMPLSLCFAYACTCLFYCSCTLLMLVHDCPIVSIAIVFMYLSSSSDTPKYHHTLRCYFSVCLSGA